MQDYPFNGKSMWASLQPGQKWSVAIGLPIVMVMLWSVGDIAKFIAPCKTVEMLIMLAGFFVCPWVYVNAFGIWIAVFIQILFFQK